MSSAYLKYRVEYVVAGGARRMSVVAAASPAAACALVCDRSRSGDLAYPLVLGVHALFQVDRLGKEIRLRRLPVPAEWRL